MKFFNIMLATQSTRRDYIMGRKITIIGAGSVGATIAYTLSVCSVASEIVIIDINEKKAEGEAMDIRQGIPFFSPVIINSGDYSDAAGSDTVIITSGIARKPGQSRLELAQINVDVMKTIIPKIEKYVSDATIIIVSNPVDILTYQFNKYSDIPENRIIGSGTILDTSRLRSKLALHYGINEHNVHACVLGEHGDSSFVPWSMVNISNVPVEKYETCVEEENISFSPLDKDEVENYVRASGGMIISRKGATYYAIAMSVCHMCKCIFSNTDTILTVSSMMHGEYGIEDVCLSTLNIVGRHGINGKVISPLTDYEIKRLRESADGLKEVINGIKF